MMRSKRLGLEFNININNSSTQACGYEMNLICQHVKFGDQGEFRCIEEDPFLYERIENRSDMISCLVAQKQSKPKKS